MSLLKAILRNDVNRLRELLVGCDDINEQCTHMTYTPLMYACIKGCSEIVDMLLRNSNIDVSIKNKNEDNVFILTCRLDNIHMLNKLLSRYPSYINSCDKDGNTLLHIACKNGSLDIVKRLLDLDKNGMVNIQNNEGMTPLMIAIITGRNEKNNVIVSELLRHGCNVDIGDVYKRTPLIYACIQNNIKIIDKLMHFYPKLYIKDINGKTAYDYAKKYELKSIIGKVYYSDNIDSDNIDSDCVN